MLEKGQVGLRASSGHQYHGRRRLSVTVTQLQSVPGHASQPSCDLPGCGAKAPVPGRREGALQGGWS